MSASGASMTISRASVAPTLSRGGSARAAAAVEAASTSSAATACAAAATAAPQPRARSSARGGTVCATSVQ